MLVQIGHACRDEEKGGKKENLHQFFNMVAAGLAGETPHMISAAVKGLARLAYEFSDLVATAYNVLPSTFLLLKRKNREIAKANLGLLKVLVAKSQTEGLQMHLRSMVEGLLNWQDITKNQFKAKVKLLLEMLVKKCGLDAVKAIKERKERKLEANSEEIRSQQSKATTSRLSRWNHTKIFSNFGMEKVRAVMQNIQMTRLYLSTEQGYLVLQLQSIFITGHQLLMSQKVKCSVTMQEKMHKAAKRLPEDLFDQLEDEPLDLLDQHKTRKAKERDASNPDSDVRSQASSHMSMNSARDNRKRRKTSDSGWAYTGGEYASKKAAGDVKRKDKLEPYAYWPLDRKMMSRRPEHRAAARKGMASVVKLTKKLEGKSASSALSSKGLRFKRVQKKSSKKKSK
ncbi:Ribosomal RNA-processing protein 12 [Vitis vinifera]|uniref:Ribosomal RNA-processing protein 12 n=1 Tax=Vitis vinifera TaxID=29760 RepID=A0A438E913_VITVI|nr:Ribosomal RNA-processing protein 12 [Vitis vinifera]